MSQAKCEQVKLDLFPSYSIPSVDEMKKKDFEDVRQRNQFNRKDGMCDQNKHFSIFE